MTETRELFDHRPQSAGARRLRLAEEPASETTLATGAMVRLVRAGWDFKVRMGRRIWSHEEITGGFWVSEQMAMHRNTERKD